MLKTIIVVLSFHYEFWQSLAALLVKQVFYSVYMSSLYEQEPSEAVASFMFMLALQVLALTLTHLLVASTGLLLTDAKSWRGKFFNEHSAAVFVIDRETNQILETNKKGAKG